MDTIGQSEAVAVTQPSLPKGGGSICGMGETLGQGGPTGQSSLSIPIANSPGRGYAPNLSLEYSSAQGNGCFGIGWGLPLLTIRRRTSTGVPRYESNDDYLAPNNEVMTPELDDANNVVAMIVEQGGETYRVTRYFPRVMDGFDRIEYWQGEGGEEDFWLIHASDGQLHCLGKTPLSRIADPAAPDKIGQWLLDESCSPNGEHICYTYKRENTENVAPSELESTRSQTANRYLMQVQYGNVTPYAPLYAWGDVPASDMPVWLFTLIFDYGERTLDPMQKPPYAPQQSWLCREDPFSDYALGFEVRTHRLCHQVLMFHHFPEELGCDQYLVSRLLFGYEQNPRLSRLCIAQNLAYEASGAVQSMPPMQLTYTPFNTDFSANAYQSLPAFPGWNDGAPYQIVDLYGEGVPGILYQVGNDWGYQAPQRGNDGPDSIGYAPWQSLPLVPAAIPKQKRLMDLTGDGRLDWIIAQAGLAGYFTLNPDGHWSHFIPLPAFPSEFLNPTAQLANLIGGGLADLGLIGPRSVRLYPNRRADGFAPPIDVPHVGDAPLPVFESNSNALVAFSDVLGSGQSHLVRVRYDGVECWPNLGWGRFDKRLKLVSPQFDPDTFDPARVFLADIDGSGAADLIYVNSDHFQIFLNRSGNGFDTLPCILPMPAGITYDRLDQVSFVDMNGAGTTSLVLTVSHMAPTHWCYVFSHSNPYLLERVNNNMGAQTTLRYRSSAQEWLDEKQANPRSVCHLPFPMPLLSHMTSLDEVSGNTLSKSFLYRQGVYSGADREFRGFGFLQQWDTDDAAASTGDDIPNTAPTITKTWYHTGVEDSETNPAIPPYIDSAMFTLGPPRFTVFNPVTEQDDALGQVDSATRYQLFRALTGCVLRTEVYGADDSSQHGIPYSITTKQYQVRQVQASSPTHPYSVVIANALADLSVCYDRIADDPQVQQTVILERDAFCSPLASVEISYPRRPPATINPYPPTVPNAQWLSSYDDSQQDLRLLETRQTVYNLIGPQVWRLGLPSQQRQNVITNPTDYTGYPANTYGLDYETLRLPNGVLGPSQTRILAGQTVTYYFNAAGTSALPVETPPPPLALVHHIETAELDNEMLAVYSGIPDLPAVLTAAGYCQQSLVLGAVGEPACKVWAIPHHYTTYVNDAGEWLPFHLPRSQQSTLIVGAESFTYDAYDCVVTSVTDAVGLRTETSYDYRFLTPWRMVDVNENQQQVLFDALGRVVATSFFGTQLPADGNTPVLVGFAPVVDFNADALAMTSIEAALADPEGALQQAATASLYAPYSWMGQIDRAQLLAYTALPTVDMLWQTLTQQHLITAQGHILAKGRQWAAGGPDIAGIPTAIRMLFNATVRSPVHAATLSAEQFALGSSLDPQQIQIMLAYSDGFGRQLQSQQKTVPGLAFVVHENGQLVLGDTGLPLLRDTTPNWRWVVSGLVDYNNKGLPVRRHQPYFSDRPGFVYDASAAQWSYADTLYYDPLGREREMVTALGYVRRNSYYPWFTVAEDLNDTLHEVLEL
ncbi:SpvB/TcaC N-terminal domain-containing protein [Shewanella sp. S23-S33]|uniref:SpvB/TcaC N-terminal domain-containing protein n=1 Tax=Shewanella sp. S23-S33 TaxID=3342769 RepID=UPI00372CF6AE